MSATALVVSYRFAYDTLQRNLDGLTEAEALVFPPPAGNCVNWIVGHLLWSRGGVHELLGLDPAWPTSLGTSEPYRRGAQQLDPQAAVPLQRLQNELTRSQAAVLGALESVEAARLEARATDTMTVGQRLAFLGFHEGYHAGQVGLLRRLLGKPGAIK